MSQSMIVLPAPFGPISMLEDKIGRKGCGHYLLTQSREAVGRNGRRLHLTLEDATGVTFGVVWPDSRPFVQLPATPSPVTVSGDVRAFAGVPELHVRSLAALHASQVAYATALLPRHRCSNQAALAFDRLAKLESELPPPLDDFLRHILLDPNIGVPFLSCRASVSHHHAYIGGLLVHSTEMLDQVAGLVRHVLPDDPWASPVAQVGYFLHDVGKLRSVGESSRTRHGLQVSHEIQTIELLAPHLRWLEGRSPELATALRVVLAHQATPHRSRKAAPYAVAEIVNMMDQCSAAAYNQRDTTHLLRLAGPFPVALTNQHVACSY